MPELPDVEVFKRYVDSTSLHRPITEVSVRSEIVEGTTPQTIRDKASGRELVATRRHGKHLFLALSDAGWLRLHFGMTGFVDASRDYDHEHAELLVEFDDEGWLTYITQRKLGAIDWIADMDQYVRPSLGS